MKKKEKTKEKEEEDPGEWWKKDYTPPPPKKESSISKLKTKLRLINNIRNRTPSWRPQKPTLLTFKCLIALLLFFTYFIITLMSVMSYPYILLLLVPTMYILLDYIKKSRKEE